MFQIRLQSVIFNEIKKPKLLTIINNRNICFNFAKKDLKLFTSNSNLNKFSQALPKISSNSFSVSSISNNEQWNKYIEDEKLYGKLLYKGSLTKQLKRAKILSLSSSAIGLALIPFFYSSLQDSSIIAKIMVAATSAFFIFVTPLLFQFINRRHVNRLYYNYEKEQFTAVLYNFFLMEYKIQFNLKDIYVPDMPGPFSTFTVKNLNRNLFVDYQQVTDLKLVEKILGYDKPIDFNKYDKDDKDD